MLNKNFFFFFFTDDSLEAMFSISGWLFYLGDNRHLFNSELKTNIKECILHVLLSRSGMM